MSPTRTLCLFALGALLFTGCDSNDGGTDTIDRVRITEIAITEFPCQKPNGDDWDGGLSDPDPDIYYVLFNDSNDDELDSTEGDEASNTECGEIVSWDTDYNSRDFERPLSIELYDEDDINSDDFMGSTRQFDLNEAFDQPTLTVSGPDGVTIRLRLEWD